MEGLRPLGVGELLDAAIRIYRGRARTLLAAVAVPVLPVMVFTTLVTWSSQSDLTVDPATGQLESDGGDIALYLAGSLVGALALVVATSVATAACYRSISGAYVGDDPDWRESVRFGFRRLWSVLGVTILTTLATLAGALLCLVGVLWPLTIFAVAVPVLLVEGTTAVGAMGRSRQLVAGHGWRTLGVVLLGLVLAMALQAAISAPLIVVMLGDASPTVEGVVTGVVQAISTVLVTPFTAALTMALYVDLRVRKEGFDLVLWAQRLGADASGGFPAQPGAPSLPVGWAPPPPGWGAGAPPGPPGQYPAPQAYPGQYPPPPPPPPPPGGASPGADMGGRPGSTSWAPPDDQPPRD